MNSRLSTGFAALACGLIASCYPYDENRQRNQPTEGPEKTVTSAEQQKIKEQRDKLNEEARKKKEQVGNTAEPTGTAPPSNTPPPNVQPPEKQDFAFANKVPGKEGFVFSPFNNKVVDVRDIPAGTLVQDPTFPAAEKKYFRVP